MLHLIVAFFLIDTIVSHPKVALLLLLAQSERLSLTLLRLPGFKPPSCPSPGLQLSVSFLENGMKS